LTLPLSLTTILAVYGAVLSTVAILRQLFSDRVKVKLTVRKNREMIGHPKYKGATLVEVKITNVGHRPVTIVSFGAIGLYPHHSLAGIDSQPQLPCEIREGQFISSFWDQARLDFSKIDYWLVCDSYDHTYKLREASIFEHWKSVFQQRRANNITEILRHSRFCGTVRAASYSETEINMVRNRPRCLGVSSYRGCSLVESNSRLMETGERPSSHQENRAGAILVPV
jgi:hypothetical protein